MRTKTSIRYFNNTPVRARWDEENLKWLYSAVDIVAAATGSENARRYWNTVKSRHGELSTACGQLELTAADGKQYKSDVLDADGVNILLLTIRGNNTIELLKWIKGLANPIDEQSRVRAYDLLDNGMLLGMESGTVKTLQMIHSYLFDGLYDFAGSIRTKNISKGGFIFANAKFLNKTLKDIEKMPQDTLDEIIEKYIEMNIAHPFMEGNGRATRIWLDLILKEELGKCVDWSRIDKNDYLNAMELSPANDKVIKKLIKSALTKDIGDRETFMKGIDYSYYYEEID